MEYNEENADRLGDLSSKPVFLLRKILEIILVAPPEWFRIK